MLAPVQTYAFGLVAISLLPLTPVLPATEPQMLQLRGATMGTTYSVKIFDPPTFDTDIRFEIDRVLREVNEQMSTYLESSEISRFNRSDSTDWFAVSRQFAEVVVSAQEVASATAGALDITIGPLVDAWSFGPGKRSRQVPDDQTIQTLLDRVDYQKLSVRLDPPALKKARPEVMIDLSAIAKGHGVDRVVEFLNDRNAHNVFVEIGGEVRVSGDKAGQWWKVGIQVPDAAQSEVLIAHSLGTGGGDDVAMATSGDYRNFFEINAVRYSHTIDPRTGRPVEHGLASVSVIADSCMKADAWATAINVLGTDEGIAIAEHQGIDALLVQRTDRGYRRVATGGLSKYAVANVGSEPQAEPAEPGNNQFAATLLITFIAFAALLFAMAIGVIFGRRSISGSCGGLAGERDEDGNVSCSLCSNPDEACKELKRRMHATE